MTVNTKPPAPPQPAGAGSRVTHATVGDVRDALAYNHATRERSLSITVHLSDGVTGASALVLSGGQARRISFGLRNSPPPADTGIG
jgi:hypothetical protein